MTIQRVLAVVLLLLSGLLSGVSRAAVEIVDLGGGDGRIVQRDKADDPDKVQPNNLSLEGTVGLRTVVGIFDNMRSIMDDIISFA